MRITQTRENIVTLLENIIKRSELMEKQTGNRNLLEIDLAMEDIRLLYREFELLRTLTQNKEAGILQEASFTNQPQSKQEVAEKPVETAESPANKPEAPVAKQHEVITETKPAAHINPIRTEAQSQPPADQPPVQTFVAETVQSSHTSEEVKTPAVPEPPKKAQQEPAPRSEQASPLPVAKNENLQKAPQSKADTVQMVAEKFTTNSNSVYERLTRIKEDKSIGARMQQKPISNIREAIGINEKFIFVNELFNGDLKSYNDSVEELNSFASIHEAFEFLNVLTDRYGWDGQRSADTIERFANLVQRRYMNL